jgi:hypothetical protein
VGSTASAEGASAAANGESVSAARLGLLRNYRVAFLTENIRPSAGTVNCNATWPVASHIRIPNGWSPRLESTAAAPSASCTLHDNSLAATPLRHRAQADCY